MRHFFFDKTDKGREALATRSHQLAPRLRPLLVLADGKQSSTDLLKKVAGLGLNEQSILELLDQGFVRLVGIGPASSEINPGAAQAFGSTSQGMTSVEEQRQAIHRFYTDTIKTTLGAHGRALQLKVNQAKSIADFRALRRPYLEALLEAKGKEVAKGFRDRLDQLLYIAEAPPNTTIIGAYSLPVASE